MASCQPTVRCGIPVHLLGTRAEVGSLVETGSGMSGLPRGMQGKKVDGAGGEWRREESESQMLLMGKGNEWLSRAVLMWFPWQ